LGFVVVTHPFHPLRGRRLEVLVVKRRGTDVVFVCAGAVGGQVTLPQSWTDRGELPLTHRLSVHGLADLAAVTRAIEGC
jgi:8-oxo-dGTP pyrophosphatase MutT (NUDIX family)